MAVSKKSDDTAVPAKTEYVVEHAPKLPDGEVRDDTAEPVIDTRLIEIRNAEAKANAGK